MSHNEKPINQIFENYLKLIYNYLTIDIKSDKISYSEKIVQLYISKKKLEEDYLNGKNFNDINSIKKFIFKFSFSFFFFFFIRYKFYTLNEFYELVESIINKNNDKFILEEILKKKKYCFDIYKIIRAIIYINEKYNNYNIFYEKGILPKIIWIYFFIIKKTLFDENEKIEFSKYGKIVCILFEYFNDSNNKNARNYYYSIYKEKLSQEGIKINNFEDEQFEKKVEEEISKINFGKDYIKEIELKRNEFNSKNKDDQINFIDIYNSCIIEDFEKKNLEIKEKNSKILPIKNIQQGLDYFVKDLIRYEILDIDLIFHRYNPKLYEENRIIYKNVINNFRNDYKPLTNKKSNKLFFNLNINNSIKEDFLEFSLQKQIFLRFLISLIENENLIRLNKFIENLQCLTYYSYFTLQYVDEKLFLIQSTFHFLNFLKTYSNFSILTSFQIFLRILKSNLPYKVIIIIRKYFDYILSIILFSDNSPIFKNPKEYYSLSQNFYTYSFNLIYSIGNKINLQEIKEKIFISFIKVVNFKDGILIKGKFIDQIILYLFAIQFNLIFPNSYNEKLIINKYNEIKQIYNSEKEKSSIPGLHGIFLNNKEYNNMDIKNLYDIILNKENNKQVFFPCNLDFKTLYLTSTNEFNTILQNSDIKDESKIYSGKKRIRALTPTINEKKIISSPFKNRIIMNNTNNFSGISAFKTLNFQGNNTNN